MQYPVTTALAVLSKLIAVDGVLAIGWTDTILIIDRWQCTAK